ncbi:unnamed protein product, partial [marine sediment metagenome]
YDFAGSSDSDHKVVVVDNAPPVITIISPLGGEKFVVTISTIVINYEVIDNLDLSPTHYAILTDLEEGTTMQVISGLEISPLDIDDGFWTLTVVAKDWAGNVASSTTAKFEVIWDTQPPVISNITVVPEIFDPPATSKLSYTLR